MPHRLLIAALVLVALPGIAHAGDFPGLVETLVTALIVLALVLGFLTEGLLALLKRRPLRGKRALAYAVAWLLGLCVLMWLQRA